jgi:hypothetical protein
VHENRGMRFQKGSTTRTRLVDLAGAPTTSAKCRARRQSLCRSRLRSDRETVGGSYTVDWQAQRNAEINAAIKNIEQAFLLIARNMGLDPNQLVPVRVQHGYGVWNVALDCSAGAGCTVDPNIANASGWPDPITFMHQGNPSWYFGSRFGFNAGHLIGGDPAGAHIDPFGPLNPLHYLIQMPAMLFASGPVGHTFCSINGGCE